MKTRLAAILLTLTAASCGVADESVVDDVAAPEATEPAAAKPADTSLHLSADVRAAIEKLPDDGGWPGLEEFQARHEGGFEPYRVIECERATYHDGDFAHETGPVMLLQVEDHWAVVTHADRTDKAWMLDDAWETPRDLSAAAPVFRKNCSRLECHGAGVETVQPTAEAFSTYVFSSVLTTPDEPVFVAPKVSNLNGELQKQLKQFDGVAWSEASIQKLLDLGLPASSHLWATALEWAKAHGRPDLAYEIHRRYRPVGRCSRDTRPMSNKRSFANLCDELDRPRCYLALSVDMLGYRVSRVSDMWIGGKPVSYDSPLDRLPAPVDRRLFMLGLLVDYPGATGNELATISPRFFALATDGASVASELEATLLGWLKNPEIDPWNRHRIAVALLFMRAYGDPSKDSAEHAAELASLDGVPAVTAARFRNIESERR